MKSRKFVTLLALALSLGMLLSLVPSTSGAFAQSASKTTTKGVAQVAHQAVTTQPVSFVQPTSANYIPPRFNRRVVFSRRGFISRRVFVGPRFGRRVFYPRYYPSYYYPSYYYPSYYYPSYYYPSYYPSYYPGYYGRFSRRVIVFPRFQRRVFFNRRFFNRRFFSPRFSRSFRR